MWTKLVFLLYLQKNYERELELHAAARVALRESRLKADKENELRQSLASQLEEVEAERLIEKNAWEETKIALESEVKSADARVDRRKEEKR